MATFPSQDRLVRKEEMLGLIRERSFPEDHIGLNLYAPFESVNSDDVIFQYVQNTADGLASARAEDAESELAAKEDTFGTGQASLIDWAIKDHYQASDVSKYQEAIYLNGLLPSALPLTITTGILDDFNRRYARDAVLRRKKLDNSLEWLIMQAMWEGVIAYNDGKVILSVDYKRPAGQQTGGAPLSTTSAGASVTPWDSTSADPIGNALTVKQFMRDNYGVEITRALASEKVIRNIVTSSKFAALTGMAVAGGPSSGVIDPRYVLPDWGDGIQAALAVFQRATGISIQPYDSVFFTRAHGATTRTMHRFSPDNKILFLPSQQSVDALDDAMGWGKTLTSPHPEGNWTSGYYEWETPPSQDPWGIDAGTGIKAFPVFPHLDLSYVLEVLAT